jgi:transposase
MVRILLVGGLSYRRASEILGVSHITVRRYDKLIKERGFTMEQLELMDDAALDHYFNARSPTTNAQKTLPDFEYIHTELKIDGVTLETLWQEYRTEHSTGYSYTHFARLYKRWARKLNISMRQTHRAGEKLFIDYSGQRLPITDKANGTVWIAEIFVAAMGASYKTFAEASRSQQIPDWIQSCTNALTYFGGVPAMMIPDNLKSAVIKHTNKDIKLNAQYVDFARHNQTVIIPARPRKPKDKSKVEGGVRLVQMWILAVLRKHVFYSLAEANQVIRELLVIFNDKPFKKIRGTRAELFDKIDKPALRPLPAEPYEYADWKIGVRVGLDYMVEFNENAYMVPHNLIDQHVDIRATAIVIEIFYRNRRVASHVRLFTPGERAINPDFMPESHKHYSEWSRPRLIAYGQSVGESTEKIFRYLLDNKPHPESGFRSCVALVEEGKNYGLARFCCSPNQLPYAN